MPVLVPVYLSLSVLGPMPTCDPSEQRASEQGAGRSAPAGAQTGAQTRRGRGEQRGDLVITEIMPNPTAVGNAVGEWFEIRNVSSGPVDPSGFVIRDDDTDHFEIPTLAPLPPGAHLVLARSLDPDENGGIDADVAYGTAIVLANSADELVIMDGSTVVDAVRYSAADGFPADPGAAMSLDPAAMHALDNDEAVNWCSAVAPYGAGDLGTPGMTNLPCDGRACGADLDGSGVVDVSDLLTFLDAWTTGDRTGDIDGDGQVGTADLLLLLAAWGPCTP